MFDHSAQAAFLQRFQSTLENMLLDLRNRRYTINEIINYYHSLNFIRDFTLIQRYNYNISVLETDLAIESEDEGEEGERE